MTRLRATALLIILAHWFVAIVHLFLAAEVLPAPNDKVSWLAVVLITSGHLLVSAVLWKIGNRLAGLVALVFFLAALSADLYEHFLHASANNIFMVASGDWTLWFNTSVFTLLALEILGCSLAMWLLGGRTENDSQSRKSIRVPPDKNPGFPSAKLMHS